MGKPHRMKEVAQLISASEEPKIVILSALSGTTNALVEISNMLATNNRNAAEENINALEAYYQQFIAELLTDPLILIKAKNVLAEHFEFLSIILKI